jgi:hypothetical protein
MGIVASLPGVFSTRESIGTPCSALICHAAMQSVPGAIATGFSLIARIEIARTITRSLSLPVLTSFAN